MQRRRILNFYFIFLTSLFSFQGNCDELQAPYLTIIGNIEMADGIGRHSVELIKSFKDELTIGFVHTRKPVYKDVPKEITALLREKKPLGSVILLEDLIWCPQTPTYDLVLPEKREDQLLLAYSVFESDQIPNEWVTRLNTHFDAVAVGDQYLVDVYQKCGVTIPVFTLPLGLHLQDFLSEPLKKSAHSPVFTFGALGFGHDRKNLIKLVQGFCLAFKNNRNIKLRINCRGTHLTTEEALKKEIHRLGLKNVDFTVQSLSKSSYLNLFKTLDCFVSVSKGEGFSIQPREAMALGIPVIVTNNTAQTTICQSSLIKEIPASIATPANYQWLGRTCGHFYDCRVEEIAQAMKEVYYNYHSYLKKSESAREWASHYHYPNMVPLYRSFLKPAKIELGNENRLEPNKMITNSKKLYEKFLKILSQHQ